MNPIPAKSITPRAAARQVHNRFRVLSIVLLLSLVSSACAGSSASTADANALNEAERSTDEAFLASVSHKTARNQDVSIHYAVTGSGPLVVFIHGFPDFWYSWRHQMQKLQGDFTVAAMDTRGYNLSDKPEGVASYAMPNLVDDVAAVVNAEGRESAVIVGHDWGGAIAWNVAMRRPRMVDLLVIMNLPHPNGLARELANNPQQQQNSQYAVNFQKEGAHEALTARGLAQWVKDPAARLRYEQAFARSDFEAMLNYYKANFPRPEQASAATAAVADIPKVAASVLMFHGLEDQALLPGGLNDTWEWLERDLTLVTIPGAGHFVQADAAEFVSTTMHNWLLQRRPELLEP